MHAKIILLLFAACGVSPTPAPTGPALDTNPAPAFDPNPAAPAFDPNPDPAAFVTPDDPDEIGPAPDVQVGHMWCCNTTSEGTGSGCVMISEANANTCANVLYCAGSWHSNGGIVTCDPD